MTDGETRLRDVFVANVMTREVETVPPEAPATEAAARLSESDIGSVLVGTGSPPPDGIVTESDFVTLAARERDPAATTVRECMSSPVVTTAPSTSLGEAVGIFADRNIKKLPVVDEEAAETVGILTTTDVAKYVPVHEFHPEG